MLYGENKITDLDGSVPISDNAVKAGIRKEYDNEKTNARARVRIMHSTEDHFCHGLFSLTYDAFLLNINFPSQAIRKRLKAQEARLKTAELVLEFVKQESNIVLAAGGTEEEKDAVNKLQSDLQEYVKFEQGNVEFQKSQEKKSPFLDFCKKVNKYFNFKPDKFAKI